MHVNPPKEKKAIGQGQKISQPKSAKQCGNCLFSNFLFNTTGPIGDWEVHGLPFSHSWSQ